MKIDLEKLGKEIDELFANETAETLTKWLEDRRNNIRARCIEHPNANTYTSDTGSICCVRCFKVLN